MRHKDCSRSGSMLQFKQKMKFRSVLILVLTGLGTWTSGQAAMNLSGGICQGRTIEAPAAYSGAESGWTDVSSILNFSEPASSFRVQMEPRFLRFSLKGSAISGKTKAPIVLLAKGDRCFRVQIR